MENALSVTHCSPYLWINYDIPFSMWWSNGNDYISSKIVHAQTSYLQPSILIAFWTNNDMITMPKPLPDTAKTSTNSRFFLKYCAIIAIEQSLVIPTPRPTTIPIFILVNIPKNNGKRNNFYESHWVFVNWLCLTIAKHHLVKLLCKWCEQTTKSEN